MSILAVDTVACNFCYTVRMTFSQFLIGVAITAMGVGITWKTEYALEFLGRNWWAEKNFGPGGSRLLYKLCGIMVCVLGIIVMTDLYDQIVGGFLTSLFYHPIN